MRKNLTRLVFAMLAFMAGLAHAFTLSGTIFGGGSPLPSATVTLYDAGTSAQLQQTTTNGSGQYSFTVNAGTYNLQVTPPSGGPYSSGNVLGIAVTTGSVQQDVVLVSAGLTLTGVIRMPDGTPIDHASINIRDAASGGTLATMTAGNDGVYSFSVGPGTYWFEIYVSASWGVNVPGVPAYSHFLSQNYVISGSQTLDITMPFVRVSGRTTDANGVAVPNVELKTKQNGTCPGFTSCHANNIDWGPAPKSDASGNYVMWLVPFGSYSITTVPPAGSGFATTTATSVSLLVDTVRDFQLSPLSTLTGVIRMPDGTPIDHASINIRDAASGGTLATMTAGNDGVYSFSVGPGTYWFEIYVSASWGVNVPGVPAYSHFLSQNYVISGSQTLDITMPFVRVSGRTTDANGVAVPNVELKTKQNGTCPGFTSCHANNIDWGPAPKSDASGNYVMWLVPFGSYSITTVPPAGSGFATTTATSVSLLVDTVRDFQLSPLSTLTGVIRMPDGTPIDHASINIRDAASGGTLATMTAGNDGVYSFSVGPGTYWFEIYVSASWGVNVPGVPAYSHFLSQNYVISGSQTLDITMPFVRVSGRTTDANGVAVPNVELKTKQNGTCPGFTSCHANNIDWGPAPKSDAVGNYVMWLVPSAGYTISVYPPPSSGFGITPVVGVSILADKALGIVLDYPDSGAPAILSGPFVRELTSSRALVEWLTNEPTSGSVTIVGAGTFTEPGAARTNHSVLLTGLAASTAYIAQVSSTDTSGNGPVTASAGFTTKPAPDTTPPVFVDGPIVTAITHQDAVVEWKSDEAASGVVDYGPTVAFGSSVSEGTEKVRQRLSLSGLSASTTYQVRASATDAAGNGPTQSATLSFKTLAAPDVDPPKIIGKPMALEVTANAATIAWVTDKPATSGVSWNDGTAYGLVTDTAYTTAHTVRITGLAAGSPYTVTASSKDEKDNGPTLSAISFNTLPAGDVLPPVITAGPQVLNLTRKTAAISWRTSEPSDARVFYGISAASLTEQEAKAKLETKHLLTLTKLTPGATYYYRVESRDVAGNASAPTAVQSFTTPTASSAAFVFEQVPVLKSKSDKSLTVEWQTSAPGDAQLECDPVAGGETKRVARAERDTKQQLTISNLQPNIAYNCRAKSIDIEGNGVEQ